MRFLETRLYNQNKKKKNQLKDIFSIRFLFSQSLLC